ncbi:hypothetical protein BC936DRAFT_137696 [Jimgerdemannia flammicorona]|uniref:WW domain-containing protein n=1 Tax=Jimgerdemannia flammicorona TaxID=994334 RepID=A0A433CWV3_9FUNG|nr:hypothetical protein BC936DRAFT_137696 [Jimgerdemannia flammicorona]
MASGTPPRAPMVLDDAVSSGNNVAVSDEHLPCGWGEPWKRHVEMRMRGDGKTYYVNHNTRTTTWHDPRE